MDTSNNACGRDGFSKSAMDADRVSATVIVPHILRLFPGSTSVADFGCGPGIFLRQFMLAGLDVEGFDYGHQAPENLVIPHEKFIQAEPGELFSPSRKYDLALSLDVADHLQAGHEHNLLDTLAAASDIIIFAAAAHRHESDRPENVRWPWHWIRLFGERDFQCIDVLRPLLWRDGTVLWQYRQNLLLFMRNEAVSRFPQLGEMPSFSGYPLIHPDMYAHLIKEKHAEIESLRQALDRRADAMAAMALVIEKNASAIEQFARHLSGEEAPGRREKVLRAIRLIPGAGFCLRYGKKAVLGVHGKIKDTRAWHDFKRMVNKTPVAGALARKGKRTLKRIIRP